MPSSFAAEHSGAMSRSAGTAATIEAFPLTPAQEQILLRQELLGSAIYTVGLVVRIDGPLDPLRLEQAIRDVVAAEPMLRAAVHRTDGGTAWAVASQLRWALPQTDWTLGDAEPESAAREALDHARHAGIDAAAGGVLWRAELHRVGAQRHDWLLCFNHLLLDGFGVMLVGQRIVQRYNALGTGPQPVLAHGPHFRRLLERQRAYLDSGRFARDQAFWESRFPPEAAAPRGAAPDIPAIAPPTEVRWTVDRIRWQRLLALAAPRGLSAPQAVMALLAAYIARLTAAPDIVVGVPIHNRRDVDDRQTVGLFANTLPLRLPIDDHGSLATIMERLAAETRAMLRHQQYPLDRLLRLQSARQGIGGMAYDLIVSFEDFYPQCPIDGVRQTYLPFRGHPAVAPLAAYVANDALERDLPIDFVVDARSPAALAATEFLPGRLDRLLDAFLDAPDLPLAAVDLLGRAERHAVLHAGNATVRPHASIQLMHHLVAQQAQRTPDAVAIRFGDTTLTYAALDGAANTFAHTLRNRGLGPGALLPVCMERSVELVVALLAVLKAGAAYVPLDPDLPGERLRRIARDCDAPAVLTQSRLHDRLDASGLTATLIDCDELARRPVRERAPDGDVNPEDLALVIFTSGSTGEPKGVMIPHRAMCNHKLWNARVLDFGPDDRVLQKTTLSFDASIWEIFVPLITGAEVILAPPGLQRDLPGMLDAVIAGGITHLTLAPSTARALLDLPALPRCAGLRCLLLGGEALDATLAARLHALLPQARMLNFYGPSETTEDCSVDEIDFAALPPTGTLPIGRPIDNTRIYVLDTAGNPVPVGVVGELHVAGLGVARGYLGRPDLTAQRFVPDPFAPAGDRMYRTGDLGYWRRDGRLAYVGRNDDQVKIRGFRVEPGEIARVLQSDPAVAQAVVVPHDAGSGNLQLAAYVVPCSADAPVTAAGLRRHLQARLPHYMIPAAWAVVPALPLTPSGKVDRQALPAPAPAPDDDRYVTPRTPTEQALWDIWSEVLGTTGFGVQDVFFDLGGHSLTLTQVRTRIAARLGQDLPLAELFAYTTIAALARRLETLPGAAPAAAPIRRVPRGAPLPASLSQRRLWVIQQFDPGSSAYNVVAPLRLRGRLDPMLLERTLALLIARHEGLRTSFVLAGDEPRQLVAQQLAVPIERLDFSHLPPEQAERLTRDVVTARSAAAFNLSVAPLHRVALIRLAADEFVIAWVLHHTIADNWAVTLLARDALRIYAAFARGETDPALDPLPIQYADFASWQRSPEMTAARREQIDAWAARLADLPVLALPTDFPRPQHPSFRGGTVSAPLTAPLRRRLQDYCSQHAVTPFIVLLAAYKLLLARLTHASDIPVGTPIANRHHRDSEQLFGTLVNTLVLRTEIDPSESFDTLVERVRDTALWAYAHQDAPFDELVERLGRSRGEHPQGLISVLFNVLNAPLGRLAEVPFDYAPFEFDRVAAQFDLSIHVDTEFAHRVQLEYATDLFAAATAQRLLDSYLHVAEQVLAEPALPLSTHALITPQQQALLREFNATGAAPPQERVVHHPLTSAPTDRGAREAVRDARGQTLSHANLEARSNLFARALRAHGIGRGDRVGLCLPRSVDLVVAVLAVLKSGAAYVPLDPTYPAHRLQAMAADARLAAVLIEAATAPRLDIPGVPLIDPGDPGFTAGHSSAALTPDTGRDAGPDDPAYMIYTSGSTGTPKAVQVPHRAVTNFLASMAREPGLGADDVLFAVTTLSFDISVLELLLPLAVGARVVLASHEQTRDPHALLAAVEGCGATVMQATPSTWRILLEAGWRGNPRLRALVGGEALAVDLAERLVERCGAVWNMYGPTESTVWSTCWRVTRPRDGISIGRPIANTVVHILDDALRPVPIGVPGEIYIGGAGVALGYFRRPELTAERFLPDPFASDSTHMYRTGDLGRWRHDGQLEHLGRLDHQVKVRGFRIEPGEIEAALRDAGDVAQCLVTAPAMHGGDRRLVAYIVPRAGRSLQTAELRDALRSRLAEHMVPQHFVALDALPLLPNGKIDRAALPVPSTDRPDGQAPQQPPATDDETIIAAIWRELLGVDVVERTDNFFDLGGHSLLAMRAVITIEQRLGRRITPRRLIFETLAQLARDDTPRDSAIA